MHVNVKLVKNGLNKIDLKLMIKFTCLIRYMFDMLMNIHAPIKQFHLRGNQVPYMSEQWRKVIHYRNRLWNKFMRERTDD